MSAVEQVERQDPENGRLSPNLGSQVIGNSKEIVPIRKSEPVIKEEAQKPYSIYTLPEKWFIVSMASLAALFR